MWVCRLIWDAIRDIPRKHAREYSSWKHARKHDWKHAQKHSRKHARKHARKHTEKHMEKHTEKHSRKQEHVQKHTRKRSLEHICHTPSLPPQTCRKTVCALIRRTPMMLRMRLNFQRGTGTTTTQARRRGGGQRRFCRTTNVPERVCSVGVVKCTRP